MRRHPVRTYLEQAGYRVSTRGGWVMAAGHGTIHRWHGWRPVTEALAPLWRWTAAFDGAAEPNPGPSAWGAWLATPLGDLAWQTGEPLGIGTNNVAEWQGLIAVLKAARLFSAYPLWVRGDSQLVVRQFNGEYAVHHPALRKFYATAQDLAAGQAVTVEWWPRERNDRADALSVAALPAAQRVFDPARLEARGERLVAHGTRDYVVDLHRGTCSCPAFTFGRRPCKHLVAARAASA